MRSYSRVKSETPVELKTSTPVPMRTASRKASARACSRAVFMSPGARPSASTEAAGAKEEVRRMKDEVRKSNWRLARSPNREPGVGRERLPTGSSAGEAGWLPARRALQLGEENLRINRVGASKSKDPQGWRMSFFMAWFGLGTMSCWERTLRVGKIDRQKEVATRRVWMSSPSVR